MNNLVMALLCLILTVSCAEDLEKKKKGEPKALELAKPLTEDLLTYEVQALENPNEYLITFKWPRTSDTIEIRRAGLLKRTMSAFESGFEEVVQGGKTYQYDFRSLNQGTSKSNLTKQINVPLDVILSGKIIYSGAKTITANRLYIKKTAEVYTYKHPLIIDVNEIIAEGGNLQNFPIGHAECPWGSRTGINGGNITIRAKVASGTLTVTTVGASAIYLRCGAGGNGGQLKVKIDEGMNLQLETKLLEAPNLVGSKYHPGTAGTACISLKAGDENECN